MNREASDKHKKTPRSAVADPRGFVTLYVRSAFAAYNEERLAQKFMRVNHGGSDGADGDPLLHGLLA